MICVHNRLLNVHILTGSFSTACELHLGAWAMSEDLSVLNTRQPALPALTQPTASGKDVPAACSTASGVTQDSVLHCLNTACVLSPPARLITAAGEPVVQVAQPHHIVMLQYAAAAAPMTIGAAAAAERLAACERHRTNINTT